MNDANGREIKIGDRIQRKIPRLFDPRPPQGGASDPVPGSRVIDYAGSECVLTNGQRGQIPVFLAHTLEVIDR